MFLTLHRDDYINSKSTQKLLHALRMVVIILYEIKMKKNYDDRRQLI